MRQAVGSLICLGRCCLTRVIWTNGGQHRPRKDAKLCRSALVGGCRFYDVTKFTPEQVRQDDTTPWHTTKIRDGGKPRPIRYKEVTDLSWQGGAGRRPLRLFVVAPTPYRKRKSGKIYYRQPAYLLTTNQHSPAHSLLQIYFDR